MHFYTGMQLEDLIMVFEMLVLFNVYKSDLNNRGFNGNG
tara:strand:+ start:71 stop:187 length:117 start_codon:yes stop_codon:yes gene_type:complete